MTEIISVMQNKGGTLKTTLTTNIAAVTANANDESKVIILDLDPQGNVAFSFGIDPEKEKHTLYDVLSNKCTIKEAIIEYGGKLQNLDVVATSDDLGLIEMEAITGKVKNLLKNWEEMINYLKTKYTHIFIDTAPYMNTFSLLAMKIATKIIIPMQPEQYAIKGLVRIIKNIKQNAVTNNIYIVPTLYVSRSKLHNQVIELLGDISKKHDIVMTSTKISKSVKAANAIAFHEKPLMLIRGNNKQTIQYHSVTFELGLKTRGGQGVKR